MEKTSEDEIVDDEFEKEQALLPPGYRFQPHDHELIIHYLRNKIKNKELPSKKIVEVDLYKFHPKDLLEKYKKYGEMENRWYFIMRRISKHPNGSRPNRVAVDGHWRATAGNTVYMNNAGKKIKVGYKKTLVFHKGKVKSNYIMHEFTTIDVKVDGNWVLCSVYEKDSSSSSSSSSNSAIVITDIQTQTKIINEDGNGGHLCVIREEGTSGLVPIKRQTSCIYEKGSSSGKSTAIVTNTETQPKVVDEDCNGGRDMAPIMKSQSSEYLLQPLQPYFACDDFYDIYAENGVQELQYDQFGSNLGTTGATNDLAPINATQFVSEDSMQFLRPDFADDLANLPSEPAYGDLYDIYSGSGDKGLHYDHQYQFGSRFGTMGATTQFNHGRSLQQSLRRSCSEVDHPLTGTNGASNYDMYSEGRNQGLHYDQFQFGSNFGTMGATTQFNPRPSQQQPLNRSYSEGDRRTGTNGAFNYNGRAFNYNGRAFNYNGPQHQSLE